MVQQSTPITVANARIKEGKTDALLLRTTPAGIRHVQMPSGEIIRFNKDGYHMGNQYSWYSLPALGKD